MEEGHCSGLKGPELGSLEGVGDWGQGVGLALGTSTWCRQSAVMWSAVMSTEYWGLELVASLTHVVSADGPTGLGLTGGADGLG